jgi:beta-xylosidase
MDHRNSYGESNPAWRWTAFILVALLAEHSAGLASGQNLTGSLGTHDPSRVIKLNGTYYYFYTSNRLRSKTSTDLTNWSQGPRVFSSAPAWTSVDVPANTGSFWAPDVAYFNDLYHLYYSVSSFGSQDSAIGLATNPTLDPSAPDYFWTDQGPVIESNPGSAYNTIDPSIIQTSNGNVWMTFGSFWNGINLVQLDPATGKLPSRSAISRIADNGSIEASYIHEHDGYYYLFVNWGACCQGVNSTYNIRMGRSTSIAGPYLDQNGISMVSGGGSLFLGSEGDFIGPGHFSVLEDDGHEWFSYHYYDGSANGTSKFNLRALRWTTDGWPVAGPPFPIPEPGSLALVMTLASLAASCRIRMQRNIVKPSWRPIHSVIAIACCALFGLAADANAQVVTGNLGIHDPSTVVKQDGKYYLFGTGQGIIAKTSNDHIAWNGARSVFPTPGNPSWTTSAVPDFTGFFWAPDIAFFNNRYHMYYSVSTFGDQTSAIGLVTNPTLNSADPNYQWTDQGAVIQSAPGNTYNAIDASIIQTPGGDVWMSFGSYVNGIYMTQLDPTTGKRITPNSPLTRVADNSSIEASYVYEHDDYYYLFVNYGTCCSGVDSTYNIRVARSTNVTGPYFDQSGRGMINSGGGTLFLGTEGQYIGPGHMGIFEEEGVEWFGYHYYNGNANGAPTYNLRTLRWTDDSWPIAGLATAPIPGDVNLDGTVDMADFDIISNHVNQPAAFRTDGDLNNDGLVNYDDFRLWKANYNPGAGSSLASSVPEPATAWLLVCAACGQAVRRTRLVRV